MRFSLQPDQRPEYRLRTVSIEEVLSLGEKLTGDRPQLEYYFSPTKKETFIKDYLHHLNSALLDARHGSLDMDQYLVFVLSFQFTAPLLEIHSQKEFGLFSRILQKTYKIEDIDLNLHFSKDQIDDGIVGEKEALKTYRDELEDSYNGMREVKESVQKRLIKDAIEAIMHWQQDKTIPSLAAAFGRSIVIPAFFSFLDKKLVRFYKDTTQGITYRVAVPDELD